MIKVIKSVVIATEDTTALHQLNQLLLQKDYSIIIEKSQTQSILKILEHQIDLLILDVGMPDSSKLDFVKIIRKTRPRLPIIVLSEDNSVETLRVLAEAGVLFCALKPIQIDKIAEVLKAVNTIDKKKGEFKSLIYRSLEDINKEK